MGYITSFDGELTIEPPIPWGEIKDSPFLPSNARERGGRDVMFRIEQHDRETPEGTLTVRRAVALVSTWEEEAHGYDIVQHVQEAVDAYPGHEFLGRMDCEGERNGDMWRLKVVNRVATRIDAVITWPEGSE